MSLSWRPDMRGVEFAIPSSEELGIGVAWPDGRATLAYRLQRAGFHNERFPTQAEAREYIENCHALWIASGGGV